MKDYILITLFTAMYNRGVRSACCNWSRLKSCVSTPKYTIPCRR